MLAGTEIRNFDVLTFGSFIVYCLVISLTNISSVE